MWKPLVLVLLGWVFSSYPLQAQQLDKGDWPQLAEAFEANDKLLIVNFWATWCRPCVAEMPHFEHVADELADENVDLVFVSADDPEIYDTRLPAFLKKKAIKHRVWLMDDTNPNNWVPKVDAGWQGDLPATLLVAPGGEFLAFHNGSLSEQELRDFVKPYLD